MAAVKGCTCEGGRVRVRSRNRWLLLRSAPRPKCVTRASQGMAIRPAEYQGGGKAVWKRSRSTFRQACEHVYLQSNSGVLKTFFSSKNVRITPVETHIRGNFGAGLRTHRFLGREQHVRNATFTQTDFLSDNNSSCTC